MGLTPGHAYTCLGAMESDDGKMKLVKVRNPWGECEYQGPFSDQSKQWDRYPDLKKRAQLENKDDGVFWMRFTDFVKYFDTLTILNIHENWGIVMIPFRLKNDENGKAIILIKIAVGHATSVYVQAVQKDIPDDEVKNWKFCVLRSDSGECIGGNQDYTQEKSRWLDTAEMSLVPGCYTVVIDASLRHKDTSSYECVVNIYTQDDTSINGEPIPFDGTTWKPPPRGKHSRNMRQVAPEQQSMKQPEQPPPKLNDQQPPPEPKAVPVPPQPST